MDEKIKKLLASENSDDMKIGIHLLISQYPKNYKSVFDLWDRCKDDDWDEFRFPLVIMDSGRIEIFNTSTNDWEEYKP